MPDVTVDDSDNPYAAGLIVLRYLVAEAGGRVTIPRAALEAAVGGVVVVEVDDGLLAASVTPEQSEVIERLLATGRNPNEVLLDVVDGRCLCLPGDACLGVPGDIVVCAPCLELDSEAGCLLDLLDGSDDGTA